jgi:hypothetical protein
MKRTAKIIALIFTLALSAAVFTACGKKDLDISKYSYPNLSAENGWTETMNTDFSAMTSMADLNAANWFPSKHGLRSYEYWCPDMIEFRTGEALVINSVKSDDHVCSEGICPEHGVFTGGIETRRENGDDWDIMFEQAYGFFEAEVWVPSGTGMWSAFWLQCSGTNKVGNYGRDGSEIDIYESSFLQDRNRRLAEGSLTSATGHAIHYDAGKNYDSVFYRSYGKVTTVNSDLYQGYHKYALLWTPNEYVFFVDGVPTWATSYGGVSQVAEVLRLTVEIRTGVKGPYGQDIGEFENFDDGRNEFKIKSVRVWQFTDKL